MLWQVWGSLQAQIGKAHGDEDMRAEGKAKKSDGDALMEAAAGAGGNA
jgi:uncharacterized protein YjbJ (UPF0337 family)